ncbi:sulfite exporter TauE/SafE family protein [Alcaligenes endophyticus]|uniref:Probable membrane transporter protein n=1 Tax=Alcaligenes endophyticus TaxID=1929088 RepID=A0ABT8EMU5_9BURK|nr:sulfite exporter TauE/SafE family protein [Alcaligenes endophyticus]MCX5591509.1 sulfite exporter TauE/SafE family protein [Alcaligenes endophyticus]MDN4122610.1 sulfite exporter TauE/SafE family protein [Alcaligenes endophyticus]
MIDTLLILGVIALGTYFQTLTGFGLGIIVIGLVSGFNLASVAFIASVISLCSIVNGYAALHGHWRQLNRTVAGWTLAGIIPSTIAGTVLLNYLSHEANHVLKLLLGLLIIYSGISAMRKPVQQDSLSRRSTFFHYGFFSGICGGLFGMPGPPIILLFYRQPLAHAHIRSLLLLMFTGTALLRTLYELATQTLSEDAVYLALLALPLVTLLTLVSKRLPPPLSPQGIRKLSFFSLLLIGVGLSAESLWRMLAH